MTIELAEFINFFDGERGAIRLGPNVAFRPILVSIFFQSRAYMRYQLASERSSFAS